MPELDATVKLADIVLMRNDSRGLPEIIGLVGKQYRKVVENFFRQHGIMP